MAHILVAGLSSRTFGFLNFHRSWKVPACKQKLFSFGRNEKATVIIREPLYPAGALTGSSSSPSRFSLKCGLSDPSPSSPEDTVLLSSKECADGSILFMFGNAAQRVAEDSTGVPVENGTLTNLDDKQKEAEQPSARNPVDAVAESSFSNEFESQAKLVQKDDIEKVQTKPISTSENEGEKEIFVAENKAAKQTSVAKNKGTKHSSAAGSRKPKSSSVAETESPKDSSTGKSKAKKASSDAESETPENSVTDSEQGKQTYSPESNQTKNSSPAEGDQSEHSSAAKSHEVQPSIAEFKQTKQPSEAETKASQESAVESLDKRLKLRSGGAMRPHPSKVATGGEDAYFIEGTSWAGVADGVGGWALSGVDSGLYSRELMKNCWLLAKSGSGVPNPKTVIVSSVEKTKAVGTCTAVVAGLHNETLYIANVGDSGFLLVRKGYVFAKSKPMQRGFNFPYQIGTDGDDPSISETFHVPVIAGDILVLATDGVYDNLYEREIVDIVDAGYSKGVDPGTVAMWLVKLAHEAGHHGTGRSPFSDAAKAAGYSYEGGKLDDATVVVSYVE